MELKKIPQKPGVYIFKSSKQQVIYVGKSVNLSARVKSYFAKSKNLGPKTAKLVSQISDIDWVEVESEIEALLLEAELIKKYQPKYNSILKDDKSYLYIKIIVGDNIPVISTSRREKPKRGVVLFGPFPSSGSVNKVLKLIRKIFPYCTHSAIQKSCLYVHLGLCPNPYQNESVQILYKKDIKKIILFFSGKMQKLIKDLESEMLNFSKNEQFEKAAQIKSQIVRINFVTQSFRQPQEYINQPTLIEDQKLQKLNQLKETLGLKNLPVRIECFDISNFSGKNATGSMVVLNNSEPDKSQYRRFRIRVKNEPNDVKMLKEVLMRRFNNDWQKPDLVVVDGGKAQLNAARKVIIDKNIDLISLAKKFEEIYKPERKDPILLKKDDIALQLVQKARDEAHRFAVSYHRKLRAKNFLL